MDIPLTTNLTPNASCLQNNQQQATNIDKVKKKSKRQSKKYPCTVKGCDQILSSKHTLSNHLIAHKNKKKYLCDDCKKSFNTERTLKQHKKTHEDNQFTCSTCDLSFVRKKSLKQHNESELHISKENNIETASKLSRKRAAKLAGFIKYSQQHTAKSNNSNTSSIQPKNYPCPFESCTLILSKKYTLIDHILIHQDEKTYHCDSCKTRVNTAKELRRHKKKHGNNKLICYTCNKTFFRKDLLDRHNKTALHARKIKNILADHSPYKPDPCITDDKSYSIGIVTELHSRLNPENQDVYQDNNNPDSLKLPDNTMIYAESVIQEEDCLSNIEKDFNENNLLDIKISSDEDMESLTAGLNYDKIVANYLQ
jgi:KRAB domain-containing zinc finger protein